MSRTAYFYHEDVSGYHYGAGHPMKPARLKLTHELVVGYDLHRALSCYRPHQASPVEMSSFHTEEYVDFLSRITPEVAREYAEACTRHAVGEFTDCPPFPGVFNYCQMFAGGSIDAAVQLNHGVVDTAINWAGGMHHAKKNEASGFCYVNDIVLAIMELLKYHARVLYIDIDIHHGDGVEEAFFHTDRVMTFSLHKFGDFFPGTGSLADQGTGTGSGYALNFPLSDGITDDTYISIYKPLLDAIMAHFQPGAIVMCCGADSLTGDRLGVFNLTLRGHATAIKLAQSYGVPLMLLGGGGYTPRNVARCWAYETSVVLNHELQDSLPEHEYLPYYRDNGFRLHLNPSTEMPDTNPKDLLHATLGSLMDRLRHLQAAPSAPFQDVPADNITSAIGSASRGNGGDLEDQYSPDVRMPRQGSLGMPAPEPRPPVHQFNAALHAAPEHSAAAARASILAGDKGEHTDDVVS